MQVGNRIYRDERDMPDIVPVFPLEGVLLLPGSQLPLNIFEPRYLEMLDDCLAGNRMIGLIQPAFVAGGRQQGAVADLCAVGCLGRVTSFSETGDGRYVIALGGICRFRVLDEHFVAKKSYRSCRIAPFLGDLKDTDDGAEVDRAELLGSFRAFLEANNLEADWKSIEQASTATLVNSLSMMSPYGPAEKQALLEAGDLKMRADTLIAITEIALARGSEDPGHVLQ